MPSRQIPRISKTWEMLNEKELEILNHVAAKQMLKIDDMFSLENFGSDAIDGLVLNPVRGKLGHVSGAKKNKASDLEAAVQDLLVQVPKIEPISSAAPIYAAA